MLEERAILESVLAKNRIAITDLHDVVLASNSQFRTSREQEDHGLLPLVHTSHSMSSSQQRFTCTPSPPPDGNPQTDHFTADLSNNGIRLAVHRSILSGGAHDASDRLKERWIKAGQPYHSRKQQRTRNSLSSGHTLTGIAEEHCVADQCSLDAHAQSV